MQQTAPIPDLRIVPHHHVHAHEEHDSQRALPLIEQVQRAQYITNPPIVAPMGDGQYVILDGANRCYVFGHLGYEHILVQVIGYDSGNVALENWHHVIGGWSADEFLSHALQLPHVSLADSAGGARADSIAHISMRDGREVLLCTPTHNTQARNAILREVVRLYQRNAKLHRTASASPAENWAMYPDGTALVVFPLYQPQDIITAAREQAYLPPGISRHIVHGRALSVNYALEKLKDEALTLEAKNAALQAWLLRKIENRQVRYYAEATYQFNEYE
jgi:hypothetical protein